MKDFSCVRAVFDVKTMCSTGLVPRVVLKGGRSKLFSEGKSPIVYGGAIDRIVGRPAPVCGDAVLVCTGNEEPIGWGVFNPNSMYRVRILETADELGEREDLRTRDTKMFDIKGLLERRIHQALCLRDAIGLTREVTTTAYRLVNSEGDRLSGLVVDVLGSFVVISSSAAWIEQWRDSISKILLEMFPGASTLVWRSSPLVTQEEGFDLKAEQGESSSVIEISDTDKDSSKEEETIQVLENGVRYFVNPYKGQKTGFYADQRDHRAFIRSIASGKEVLDLCCYSGGFAINAALGNALYCLGVDSSSSAISLARRNAATNGLSERQCAFQVGNVADVMKAMNNEHKLWDIVILDPPKLAPSKRVLKQALRKYSNLNAAAMRIIRPGGLLMTCSCSGAVTQTGVFAAMLQDAAKRSGRRITIVRHGSAGSDHPIDPGYPEGQYLTNVVVRVL